ncbi:MAG: hypothetical protein JO314_05160 [Acidobacteria bacterium]|nr:hypothetical protein [Acidobacteriota bacterium]
MKFGLTLTVALLAISCAKQATPVDLANVCAADNEKKYISTVGYLNDGGSIFCSNTGGRMDCSLDLAATAGGARVLGAEIEQGSGASEIEKFEGSYKKEDLKIHDANGGFVKIGDKVRVTGELSVVPGSTCFMEIDKIEKQ